MTCFTIANRAVRSMLGFGLAGGARGRAGYAASYTPAGAALGTAAKPIRAWISGLEATPTDRPPMGGGGLQPTPRTTYAITVALAMPGETVTGGVTADGAVERLAAGDRIVFAAADLPGVKPDGAGADALTVTFTIGANIRTMPGSHAIAEVSR